jgi:hypothetical protein
MGRCPNTPIHYKLFARFAQEKSLSTKETIVFIL